MPVPPRDEASAIAELRAQNERLRRAVVFLRARHRQVLRRPELWAHRSAMVAVGREAEAESADAAEARAFAVWATLMERLADGGPGAAEVGGEGAAVEEVEAMTCVAAAAEEEAAERAAAEAAAAASEVVADAAAARAAVALAAHTVEGQEAACQAACQTEASRGANGWPLRQVSCLVELPSGTRQTASFDVSSEDTPIELALELSDELGLDTAPEKLARLVRDIELAMGAPS